MDRRLLRFILPLLLIVALAGISLFTSNESTALILIVIVGFTVMAIAFYPTFVDLKREFTGRSVPYHSSYTSKTVFALRARGWLLILFLACVSIAFLVACYVYIVCAISVWLLVAFAIALVFFYLWVFSIRLSITSDVIVYRNGFAPVRFVSLTQVTAITIGEENLLTIYSNNSETPIRMNYSFWFTKRDLRNLFRLVEGLAPHISLDETCRELLANRGDIQSGAG